MNNKYIKCVYCDSINLLITNLPSYTWNCLHCTKSNFHGTISNYTITTQKTKIRSSQ